MASLIRQLLELLDYQLYLQRTQEDWATRWENVQELINFASEHGGSATTSTESKLDGEPTTNAVDGAAQPDLNQSDSIDQLEPLKDE